VMRRRGGRIRKAPRATACRSCRRTDYLLKMMVGEPTASVPRRRRQEKHRTASAWSHGRPFHATGASRHRDQTSWARLGRRTRRARPWKRWQGKDPATGRLGAGRIARDLDEFDSGGTTLGHARGEGVSRTPNRATRIHRVFRTNRYPNLAGFVVTGFL